MSVIMFFDWFIQYIGLKESNNKRRFVTGILGGLGTSSLYLRMLRILVLKAFKRWLGFFGDLPFIVYILFIAITGGVPNLLFLHFGTPRTCFLGAGSVPNLLFPIFWYISRSSNIKMQCTIFAKILFWYIYAAIIAKSGCLYKYYILKAILSP